VFKKLPKVNNHPIGENSPNLVTLVYMYVSGIRATVPTVNRTTTEPGAGLPDGFFSNQKSQFGKILEGLRWENVDIF
jgi:hypothetical protein